MKIVDKFTNWFQRKILRRKVAPPAPKLPLSFWIRDRLAREKLEAIHRRRRVINYALWELYPAQPFKRYPGAQRRRTGPKQVWYKRGRAPTRRQP